jgi:hypothetical protein
MRRNGIKPLRAAQAPSNAVARADRPIGQPDQMLHALQEVLVMSDVEQQGQLR